MKKIFRLTLIIFVLIQCTFIRVNCQVISGIIKDNGGKTVAYATIGVKRNSDTLTIVCVSDSTGYYNTRPKRFLA